MYIIAKILRNLSYLRYNINNFAKVNFFMDKQFLFSDGDSEKIERHHRTDSAVSLAGASAASRHSGRQSQTSDHDRTKHHHRGKCYDIARLNGGPFDTAIVGYHRRIAARFALAAYSTGCVAAR